LSSTHCACIQVETICFQPPTPQPHSNNAKFRERGKKEETKRLREFVEAAYRLDPRVAAKKEADKAERERKRAEKEAAARAKVEEEERRKAEEEAARWVVIWGRKE
jgi:DnaJ family protein C protein 2